MFRSPKPNHLLLSVLFCTEYLQHSSVIWIETDHQIIISAAHLDFTTSGIVILITFTLAEKPRQLFKSEVADTPRKRRRGRRVTEVAVSGGNSVPVGACGGGRLPHSPCTLRHGDSGDLGNQTFAGADGILLDGRTNTIRPAFLAGVRGSVTSDVTDVCESPNSCFGGAAGFQLLSVVCPQLIMRVSDECDRNDGFSSSISRGSPMDHALGVEMIDSCCDTRC